MATLFQFNGDGLAADQTVTTATAGTGDTPPAAIQGIAPITRDSGIRPVRFEFDQGSPITQTSYLVWAHTATNVGAWRWYQNTPNPGGGQRIATAWSGVDANVGWTLDVNFAGVLVLGDAGGTVDTGTVTVTDDVEYRIGVTYDAGTVEVTCYIGDNLTPLDTLSGVVADRQINEFWWGNTFNFGTAGLFHLDSLTVADDDTPLGSLASQFPSDNLKVFIAPGGNPATPGSWNLVDITEYVRHKDGIDLTVGLRDEGSVTDPSEMSLVVENQDGRFSPRNPLSPYFGQLAVNTPIVVVWEHNAINFSRFLGFVAEWPPRWSRTGADATAEIQANGNFRRLQLRKQPLRSALRRAIPTFSEVVAYWPMEDAENSTQFFSPIPGVPSMIVDPDTTPAAVEGPGGSDPLPNFAASDTTTPRFFGGVPFYIVGVDGWRVDWLFRMDEQPASLDQIALRVFTDGSPVFEWRVTVGDDIRVIALDQDLSQIYNNGETIHADFFGGWVRFILHIDNDGTDLRYALFAFRPRGAFPIELNSFTDDVLAGSGQSPGRALSAGLQQSFPSWDGDRSIGHITVTNGLTDPFQDNADDGYAQEFVAERLERLCAEENVPFQLVGVTNTEPLMGPQRTLSFLDLIIEAAELDGGYLYGDNLGGITYRDQATLYNQTAAMVIDQTAGELSATPKPTDDDQQIRNNITVQRTGGSSVRVVDQASVDLHGQIDESLTLNVDRDEELEQLASWRLHLGTWDDMRWPRINIALNETPNLIEFWLSVSIGDRITVTHDIEQLPGLNIDLIVVGWSERFDQFTWTAELNCIPAGPYTVNVLGDDVLGRLDTDGSELAAGIDDDDTSLSVTVDTGPLWTTDDTQFPFTIRVGGEIMTVTDITGASSPQTFTVTRSVNGVVKSHSLGTGVNVWPGFRLAL